MILPFHSLSSFLVWSIGPGLPIVVGILVSILFSNLVIFNKLPHDVKAAIPFVIAVLYAYIANAILKTPDIVNNADVNFIFNTFLVYYATQKQFDRTEQAKLTASRLADDEIFRKKILESYEK